MRTDIITDKRQVICKNSSRIGYSTYKVRIGDFVMWDVSGHREVGRMLGRITWTSTEGKCLYILVARLSHDCTFVGGERWIKPEDVTEAYQQAYYVGKVKEAMRMFLGHETRRRAKRDLTDARMAINEMWSSWKRFDDWKERRNGGRN